MPDRSAPRALAVAVVALTLAACGSDADRSAAPSRDSRDAPSTTLTARTAQYACGISLTEVQALLPNASGLTENHTPDPGRCNFTWNDGGPRGIDVAIVNGGRTTFNVPANFEPIDGYGDEAYTATASGQASAVAFVGDDLYAADVVAEDADVDLRDLCLQLLESILD